MDPCQGKTSFVLDISSDEEGCCLLEDEPLFADSDDSDWLAELLREESEASPGGNSDEVVVIKEVNPKSKSKGSQQLMDNDDDDCVILDSNPDKPVAASDGSAVDHSSDDLVIVGETGQVACRDYPHSRHLCCKFPFSTVSHEKHCSLCHCYVCDLPAPCIYWGTGALNTDHCHATDREDHWRVQRKQSRGEKPSPAPSLKPQNGSNPAVPQLTPVPLPLGPTHIVANCSPNNSVGTLNPCSTPTISRFSTGNASARSSPLSNLASQNVIQLDGVIAQRFRACRNGSQLMPHCVSSSRTFKRVGPNSSHRTSQHAWNLLHNNWNPVCVQKNPTSRRSLLPCVRPTSYINPSSSPSQLIDISSNIGPSPLLNSEGIYKQPSTYPAIADATCVWPNEPIESFQQCLPAQAQGGNVRQFQTCQAVSVNEPDSQSVSTYSLTAAAIESWLLEDTPHQDIEGTHSFNLDNLLDECDSNM